MNYYYSAKNYPHLPEKQAQSLEKYYLPAYANINFSYHVFVNYRAMNIHLILTDLTNVMKFTTLSELITIIAW